MWGRLKALFSRDRAPAPPATSADSVPPISSPVEPLPEAADEAPPAAPERPRSDHPFVIQTDAQFLEVRKLAHSLKLGATIGISAVQNRYKLVRHLRAGDPVAGMRALRVPIHAVYSENLGQELMLLAFVRSLRRKYHHIVAQALEAVPDALTTPAGVEQEIYHLTRAEQLSQATKFCLEQVRLARERGDGAFAERLCALQVELLQRQLNVRVPLDEPVAKAAVWQWLGFVHQTQGKAEEAEKAFHTADEINPPHEEYRDPVAEAMGDWRTFDLDEFPREVAPASASDSVVPPEVREAACAVPTPKARTASEMLRVDLPEPPDLFGAS